MQIVDGQVHIWAANTPERPWPAGSVPQRPVPFSADDAIREMDVAGVHRAVLVPPRWEGWRNDLALEAARSHPDRFAVMGRLDIDAPNAREKIARWRQQLGMLGLRVNFKFQGDPTNNWLWSEAQAAGMPIMVSVSAAKLPLMDQAAERYPDLKLIIDHLAILKGKKDDAAFAHLDSLLVLARHPNVAVKASSLPTYTTQNYPYRNLHPHIRRVYDAFGPKRMFWGSDLTKMPCTYRQSVTMFTEEIPWFTAEDKEWIMGRGLSEWIGWKLQ